MISNSQKHTKYNQNEVYIHRNTPLESPGGILVCLANIFASVPLSIQKAKRHAARVCLPCLHSPCRCRRVRAVRVYGCVNAMLQSISRDFSVSSVNIFASLPLRIQTSIRPRRVTWKINRHQDRTTFPKDLGVRFNGMLEACSPIWLRGPEFQ